MREINKLIIGNKPYDLISNSVKMFLYQCFNIFMLRNKIDNWDKNRLLLQAEQLLQLKLELESTLEVLLFAGYEIPNEKHIQKHHASYQRINFRGKKYVLDYRTSEFGRLAFYIYVLIDVLNSSYIEGREIYLVAQENGNNR